MNKSYQNALTYFLIFSMLLVISSVLLFENKIGFSLKEVATYYLGDEESYVIAKTYSGLIKMVSSHIFAFGLLSMVLLHFLIFTKERVAFKTKILIYAIFLSSFLEIFSPFAILFGVDIFSLVKLGSFALLEFLIIYISWLLLRSIVHS